MAVQDVVVVDGTALYYEMYGTGPSVLYIAGTTGDAGHFAVDRDPGSRPEAMECPLIGCISLHP
jgi:hypothetical protein